MSKAELNVIFIFPISRQAKYGNTADCPLPKAKAYFPCMGTEVRTGFLPGPATKTSTYRGISLSLSGSAMRSFLLALYQTYDESTHRHLISGSSYFIYTDAHICATRFLLRCALGWGVKRWLALAKADIAHFTQPHRPHVGIEAISVASILYAFNYSEGKERRRDTFFLMFLRPTVTNVPSPNCHQQPTILALAV